MTDRLRITFATPSPELGGAERALLLLLAGLDRTRWEPAVVCPGPGRLSRELQAAGVPVRYLAALGTPHLTRFGHRRGPGSALRGLAALALAGVRLGRMLRGDRPALLHTNGIKAHVAGAVAARRAGCPLVWHMRDLTAPGPLRAALSRLGRTPRRIAAVSGCVRDQFTGPARDRCVVIHDAPDPAHCRPHRSRDEVREHLGVPPGAPLLAMVAHFTRWKGHDVFVRAVGRLAGSGTPVHAVVVGASLYASPVHGGFEEQVRSLARTLAVGDRVHFAGYQDHPADFVAAADLLLHPPTQPEPFGLAVVEAMAMGVPVVASAAGGPLETVAPGVTGLLVPPGDPAALADAAAALLADPERRRQMGEAGRERVLRRFHPDRHHREMDSLFRTVIEG